MIGPLGRRVLRFDARFAGEGYGGGFAANLICLTANPFRLAALATHPLNRGGQGRYVLYFCVNSAA